MFISKALMIGNMSRSSMMGWSVNDGITDDWLQSSDNWLQNSDDCLQNTDKSVGAKEG